jgi:hypothetical protein
MTEPLEPPTKPAWTAGPRGPRKLCPVEVAPTWTPPRPPPPDRAPPAASAKEIVDPLLANATSARAATRGPRRGLRR